MRRADRQQDRAFCLDVIDRCSHGVVAISTGEDMPYCLPLSLVRVDNSLYFHCAKEGRKVELLRKNPQVCITFVAQDEPAFLPPATYTTHYRSVIATGAAVEVTQAEEKTDALRALCQKTMPDHMAAFEQAIAHSLSVTAVWRIDLEKISGKAKLKK